MRRAPFARRARDGAFGALWATIGRTLRLLVALALATTLLVLLLHGLNLL